MFLRSLVVLRILVLGGGADHLAKLVLLGELAAENAQVTDQLVACVHYGVLWGDLAVGLDAQEELVLQGMRDLQ